MANEIKQVVSIEANLTKIQADFRALAGNFRTTVGNMQGDAKRLDASFAGIGRQKNPGGNPLQTADGLLPKKEIPTLADLRREQS